MARTLISAKNCQTTIKNIKINKVLAGNGEEYVSDEAEPV